MLSYAKQLVCILFLSSILLAHGPENAWEALGIPDPMNTLYIGSGIAIVGILAALILREQAGETQKKLVFAIISIPIVLATLYLSATTIYLNMVSETGGPVHWHADFEVWACGEKHELVDPTGLENRVGTAAVHEHGESRIHIEGVLLSKEEAMLDEFFEAVGGEFHRTALTLPTNHGMKTWRNGDRCNGRSARWYMFVNGELNEEMNEYMIAPYSTVPPGDRIKLVFTEKPLAQINGELGEET